MDTVYVDIRHWLFWYGHYGLCNKSCNDEITLYLDKGKKVKLGYFEISTIASIKYIFENHRERLEGTVDYIAMEKFLESEDDIYYNYQYPTYDEDGVYQVEHFAPVNEEGYKPEYIEMWSKLSEGWDINEIKKTVKILAKEFLHEDIVNVEILNIPTYEETKLSYEEDFGE